MSDDDVQRAAASIRRGEAVVYPTETVYGMGADATNADAVERVFDIKSRDRDKPLSAGFPDVDAALEHVVADDREEAFMRRFLPGPVTVVVERRDSLPDALVAGKERVGVRVPDHELALALFRASGTPVTATSANRSGTGSITHPSQLSDEIREAVAVVLDGGTTSGTESTVVDPGRGVVHRRGAMADDIEAWLDEHAADA
ncbi:threonylcarbamoyl-AMP synthase [Haloferax sp. Atlit-10N]|uniref:L-threonylcarbamoyladenylate synthase n=1 Tax=unclassified Haloferax TaxID=2625095 RepID=UPI000E227E1F|nr:MULTISPECIES: L-threonylcarbamoyladenylate synthase [unclassified Haloferax]RDZ43060.1 threonylcarbamoyl-AMP synthase [Haloferax sp. Atlit-16N]RDZ57635.1 threonylcarbamoyl-AMP synthase [Haloferax sp. Atlit-10N]